jgi:hypothetical protein
VPAGQSLWDWAPDGCSLLRAERGAVRVSASWTPAARVGTLTVVPLPRGRDGAPAGALAGALEGNVLLLPSPDGRSLAFEPAATVHLDLEDGAPEEALLHLTVGPGDGARAWAEDLAAAWADDRKVWAWSQEPDGWLRLARAARRSEDAPLTAADLWPSDPRRCPALPSRGAPPLLLRMEPGAEIALTAVVLPGCFADGCATADPGPEEPDPRARAVQWRPGSHRALGRGVGVWPLASVSGSGAQRARARVPNARHWLPLVWPPGGGAPRVDLHRCAALGALPPLLNEIAADGGLDLEFEEGPLALRLEVSSALAPDECLRRALAYLRELFCAVRASADAARAEHEVCSEMEF